MFKKSKPYYVAHSSYLRDKPNELGTFANYFIQKGTNVGCAMKIPPGTQVPALDWERTELCLMTNHCSYPNMSQKSYRDTKSKLIIVDYIASRDILPGEELLVDYTKFEFNRMIDLSFLHPNAGKVFVYNQLYGKENIARFHAFGVCSTHCLAEKFNVSVGKLFSINTIIPFTILPLSDHHPKVIKCAIPCVEVKIDIVKLFKFRPIFSEQKKSKKWELLFDQEFIGKCNKLAMKEPTEVELKKLTTVPVVQIGAYFIHKELFESDYKDYKKDYISCH